MTSTPSVIGGACIIASVCVGAGMLGLPSAGAGAWTSWYSVTKDLLGHRINLFNNLTVYFVGGILLYAYITSSGLILGGLLGINSQLASVLFVLVFSWFVWHSTRAVDRISVVLIVFMVLSFVFGVSGLASKVDTAKLFNSFAEELGSPGRSPRPSTSSPWRPSSPPSSGWGSGCSTIWRICSGSTTAAGGGPNPDRLGLHHPRPAGEKIPGAGATRGRLQGPRRSAHGGSRHPVRGADGHLPPDGYGGHVAHLYRLTSTLRQADRGRLRAPPVVSGA